MSSNHTDQNQTIPKNKPHQKRCGEEKRSVEWCGKEQEVKNSGERSAIGKEAESTYSPVYLLNPVGDSFH